MLRMLCFDSEITNPEAEAAVDATNTSSSSSSSSSSSTSSSSSSSSSPSSSPQPVLWGRVVDFNENSYPKLNKEIVQLCQSITEAVSPAATTALKKQLMEVSGSMERFYEVIRYFKWSKTFCTWLYGEAQLHLSPSKKMKTMKTTSTMSTSSTTHSNSATHSGSSEDKVEASAVTTTIAAVKQQSMMSMKDVDFYGLRPQDSKSSAYIIRILHKDFDAVTGRTTGTLQAALSNIESDETVLDVIHHIERLTVLDSTTTDEAVSKTTTAIATSSSPYIVSPTKATRSPNGASYKTGARSEQNLLYRKTHVTHFKVSPISLSVDKYCYCSTICMHAPPLFDIPFPVE